MPRFRPTAKFEHSAVADLWKHTLSHIPTTIGRVIYLAGLRDLNSGTYRHHGLSASFGRDESVRALRESHLEAFQGWLTLSLAEKNRDLREYFAGLETQRDEVVDHWLRSGAYRTQVPPGSGQPETELFCRDLETLLQLLEQEALTRRMRPGAEVRDRDSSRPA